MKKNRSEKSRDTVPLREKGGVGKIFPIGCAHLHLSVNFQNNQKEKGECGRAER